MDHHELPVEEHIQGAGRVEQTVLVGAVQPWERRHALKKDSQKHERGSGETPSPPSSLVDPQDETQILRSWHPALTKWLTVSPYPWISS